MRLCLLLAGFIKLALGKVLKESILLVTSRPTACNLFKKLFFKGMLKLLVLQKKKIQEYVSRFCDIANDSSQKSIIWDQIKLSSELSNLRCIPVKCYIVCVTLIGCVTDTEESSPVLPTTLTELYLNGLYYFEKNE